MTTEATCGSKNPQVEGIHCTDKVGHIGGHTAEGKGGGYWWPSAAQAQISNPASEAWLSFIKDRCAGLPEIEAFGLALDTFEEEEIKMRMTQVGKPGDAGPTSWCPQCGNGGRCDEDGCCALCGATLITVEVLRSILEEGAANACPVCFSGRVSSKGPTAREQFLEALEDYWTTERGYNDAEKFDALVCAAKAAVAARSKS